MRVIFLDIDGVLNCDSTKERYLRYIGIDPKLVDNLAVLVKKSDEVDKTVIVLSSSWRLDQTKDGDAEGGLNHVIRRLKEAGLELYDATPNLKGKRGKEIYTWLNQYKGDKITGYAVLDDRFYVDFKEYKVSKHLVRTSSSPANGGLREKHINRALKILDMPFVSVYNDGQ